MEIELKLALINLGIALLALLAAFYAIYQVRIGDNLKITITDAIHFKYNNVDPYLLSFSINNHSSKSLQLVKFDMFIDEDCTHPLVFYKNVNYHGVGYKPPVSDSIFEMSFYRDRECQSENHIHYNHVLHANSSFEGRYYVKEVHKQLVFRIKFDKRMSNFKKNKIIIVKLKSPKVEY